MIYAVLIIEDHTEHIVAAFRTEERAIRFARLYSVKHPGETVYVVYAEGPERLLHEYRGGSEIIDAVSGEFPLDEGFHMPSEVQTFLDDLDEKYRNLNVIVSRSSLTAGLREAWTSDLQSWYDYFNHVRRMRGFFGGWITLAQPYLDTLRRWSALLTIASKRGAVSGYDWCSDMSVAQRIAAQHSLAHSIKRLIDVSRGHGINEYLMREDPAFHGLVERWATATYISQGSGQPMSSDDICHLQRGVELWERWLPADERISGHIEAIVDCAGRGRVFARNRVEP